VEKSTHDNGECLDSRVMAYQFTIFSIFYFRLSGSLSHLGTRQVNRNNTGSLLWVWSQLLTFNEHDTFNAPVTFACNIRRKVKDRPESSSYMLESTLHQLQPGGQALLNHAQLWVITIVTSPCGNIPLQEMWLVCPSTCELIEAEPLMKAVGIISSFLSIPDYQSSSHYSTANTSKRPPREFHERVRKHCSQSKASLVGTDSHHLALCWTPLIGTV
jgi:hypothetical protein